MIQFSITIHGHAAVANELRTAAAKAQPRINNVVYSWAQTVREGLKSTPYPPKRAGQKYVRSGRLANSWRAEKQGNGVVIANSARNKAGQPYAGYVVGNEKGGGQAWMHRGRWWTARGVIDKRRGDLKRDIVTELTRLFPRGGQ